MDLNELIPEVFGKVIKENFKNSLESEAKKCINDVIRDMFCFGSKIRREIEDKIEGQIKISLQNFKIEDYNSMITKAIQGALNEELSNRIIETIKENVTSNFYILDKREYKLSEIVEEFKNNIIQELNHEEPFNFTVLVENSSFNFTYIYMDEEENQAKYKCKYRITMLNNKVVSCSPIEKPVGELFGFERLLFALYANNVKIEVDHDYDTYIDNY